jgi:methylase of polypeptide subunit release factors
LFSGLAKETQNNKASDAGPVCRHVVGVDLDEDALELARDNCEEFEVEVDLVRAEISGRENHGKHKAPDLLSCFVLLQVTLMRGVGC